MYDSHAEEHDTGKFNHDSLCINRGLKKHVRTYAGSFWVPAVDNYALQT
jgi:hypothetical protein